MAASVLQRWLAEAVWFPTALRPGAALAWTTLDDSTARATVTDGANHASVHFHFAPGGEVAGITTERYRDVNGKPVLTPWRGTFGEHRRVDGMMLPSRGEVGWVAPDHPRVPVGFIRLHFTAEDAEHAEKSIFHLAAPPRDRGSRGRARPPAQRPQAPLPSSACSARSVVERRRR